MSKEKMKTSIGGQAVIEGVMMRAPNKFVIAVRQPNGTIAVKRDDIKLDSNKILKKPILRGLIGLYDALVLGIKALNIVCGFSELDYLITDEQADKKMLKLIREQGVEVITV